MQLQLPVVALCAASCLAPLAAQTVLYVSPAGSNFNSGRLRTKPLLTLSYALQQARVMSTIREIRLSYGTYKPGTSRSSSFRPRSGLAIKGGYDRSFLFRSVLQSTVLSGEIGNPASRADNSRAVVMLDRVDNVSLDRLLIVDGQDGGASSGASGRGAGVHVASSSVTITNCVFRDNHAQFAGGGIHASAQSDVYVWRTTFLNNRAGLQGGAASLALNSGSGAAALFDRCRFLSNQAVIGGALYFGTGRQYVFNSMFSNNRSPLSNRNSCGGAVASVDTQVVDYIVNCSMSRNFARVGGGICGDRPLQVRNSIVCGNVAATSAVADIGPASAVFPQVRYCCVQSRLFVGAGNLKADPHFLDPLGRDGRIGTTDDNLRIPHPLVDDSPCVDRGSDTLLGGAHLQLDLDGGERRQQSSPGRPRRVDMGAYEVAFAAPLHAAIGDDLALRVRVDNVTTHVAGGDAVDLRAGDRMLLDVESPRGSLRGKLAFVSLDAFVGGSPPVRFPIAGFRVGPSGAFFTAGSVPARFGGNGILVPPGLSGAKLIAQAMVFDPAAANGVAFVTNGRELRFR